MATIRELSDSDIAIIKARIRRGDKYAEIASDYRLNQGRIADLKFDRIRSEVVPADIDEDGRIRRAKKVRGRQLQLF